MTPDSRRSAHVLGRTIKSLVVGLSVFYLGRELAVWLTTHNVHGFSAFLDNVAAGIAAGLVVLLYERRRQHAVDILRQSEERFRLAALAGKMFAYEWDAATDVILRSPDFANVLGDEPVATTGQQTLGRIHPDDRERVKAAVAALSPKSPHLRISYRMLRNDGTFVWVERNSRAHFDEQGRMLRVVGMVVDITERKLAEQELSSANERLHLAMESGSVGGWDYDVKTGKNVLFGMAHAQLGMSPDETSGSREEFWDHVHEDDRERYRSAIAAAREKKEHFDGEFRVVWRDGTIRWLRTRGRYYYTADGDPERVLGISIDITERKQAEQTLRESEQRLRLATQVGRMYAYDWDVTKDVVVRSSEHVKLLGLTEPLHLPQQGFVDKLYPEDRPKFLAAVAGLTPENPTAEVTYRVLAPDGTLSWLRSNGRGFFDAEGRLVRVIGMVADVTDVKRAEEELSEMTRKLVEAQEQERARIARELHDDVTQRLAMLAIEIEQVEGLRPETPTEVRDWAHELSKRAKEISTDIQALSHELHSSRLEYLGIVGGMKSWCSEFGERRGIEIEFNPDVQSSVSPEISLCLFRVLQEALHNAPKHSGVKRVDVQLREKSGEIQLTVSDLGKGFDVAATTQDGGLGVTSMRERVRLVGGTIVIDSKPLGGTTIHVRVPLGTEPSFQRAAG